MRAGRPGRAAEGANRLTEGANREAARAARRSAECDRRPPALEARPPRGLRAGAPRGLISHRAGDRGGPLRCGSG